MGKRRRGASRREVAWLKKLDAELAQQLESVEEWAAAHRREHEEGAATYAEHTAIGKTLVEIFDHVQAVEMAPAVAEGDVFSKGGEGPARRNFDLEQIEVALAEDGVVSPFATSTHAVDVALAPGWDGLELATLRDAIYIVAARKWEAEAMKKEDAEAHSTNGCGEERGDGEGFMAQPLWRATTAALSWDDVLITYAPAFTWGDWSAVADLLASAMHLAREPHPNRGALNCAVMWHTRLADSVVSPVPSSQSYLTAFDHATQVKLREAVKSYIDANQQPDGGLPSGAVSDLCARVLSATGVRLLPHQALRLEAEYRLAFQRPVPTETVNDVFTSHELSLLRELLAEHTQAHPDFLHSTFRQEARARQGREVAKASAAGKTVTKVTRATGQSKKQNAPPAAPQPYRLAYRLGLKRSFVTWAWAQRYMLPGFAQTPPPLSLIRNPPRLATPRQSLENLVAAACYGVGDREIKPYTPGAVKENQGPALQKKRLRHPWAVGLEPQMSRISAVTGRFGEGYGVYAVGKYARWQHASFGERLRRLHRCSTTRVPAARDAPEGRRTVTRRFRGSAETVCPVPTTQYHLPPVADVTTDGSGKLSRTPAAVLKAVPFTEAKVKDVAFAPTPSRICTTQLGPGPSLHPTPAIVQAVARLCAELCNAPPTAGGFVAAYNSAATEDLAALTPSERQLLDEAESHPSGVVAASAFAAAFGEPSIAAAKVARWKRFLQ